MNFFSKLEPKDWLTFAGILVVGLGWFVSSFLQSSRDARNRQAQMVIEYRVRAFQNLASASNRPISDDKTNADNAKKFEDAVTDIELFGTSAEIEAVKDFLNEWNKPQPDGRHRASTDPLLLTLRGSLRKDLNLSSVTEPVRWIRPLGGAT
jgi:hypothetical protein